MIEGKVISIGQEAIGEEPMLILFDKSVESTEELKKYAIIQEVAEEATFELQSGNKISFDDQEYVIAHVGPAANRNLTDINHVTLVFTAVPEEDVISNGVYLTPLTVPSISVGTKITYQ